MKALIASRSIPLHGGGGMEVVAWDLARGLAAAGAEVDLVTTAVADRPATFELDSVTVHPLDAPAARYSPAWWEASRRFYRRAGGEADAVISVSVAGKAMLGDRSRRDPTAFVFQAHGTARDEVRTKVRSRDPARIASAAKNCLDVAIDMRWYRRFDAIVAVGPGVASSLGAFPYSPVIDSAKVVTIPNGVDTSVFAPVTGTRRRTLRSSLGLAEDDYVVVTAGRLHQTKGIDDLIDALALITRRGRRITMLVAGDGPHRDQLAARCARLGVSSHVRFMGQRTRHDLAAILAAGDVFVYPTRRVEGLPMGVLEALAVGLPCITTISASLPTDLGGVRVVPTSRPDLLAGAIAEAGDGDRRPRLPGTYRLESCVARYLALLEHVIASPRHSRRAPARRRTRS